MATNRLMHLYVEELKDLYSAENQLVKALPKMAKAATDPDLKAGFQEHLEQTKGHVSRLEEVFKGLGESPRGKKCVAMEGLVKEGGEMIESGLEAAVLDAGLISAAQRVEHYEIAAYGTVIAFANTLGEEEAESVLKQTLEEEKETDRKLTQLSDGVNREAASAPSVEQEEDEEKVNGREKKTKAAQA
jgi:ferritin-like metal-binding protein YciE